ncbi:MAG: three component ABC system middle component [Acidobacteriaceae bacterium]
MQSWSDRVIEEANLFNPAFCAALLGKSADEFVKKAHHPLPFAVTFLVLPIVLHQATRRSLPGSTITSLLTWIQTNREQLVDFAVRVQRLRRITREALLFGVQHQALAITNTGDLDVGAKRRAATEKRTELFTDEARECVDRAGFIGRWFAAAGTTATIYAAWGVVP